MPIIFAFDDRQLPGIRPIGIVFDYQGTLKMGSKVGDANFPYRLIRFVDGGRIQEPRCRHSRVGHTLLQLPEKKMTPIPCAGRFFILFQTADGRLGMIDPSLENEQQ